MATETAVATQTHTIVHYEIPAKNAAELVKFYSNVFGWKFSTMPGMDTYHVSQTGEDCAGVAVFEPDTAGVRPINYIGVESVKAHVAKLKEHGGTIMHEFIVSGMGRGAIGADPDGNPVGLWQPDMDAKE
ncbi:MAG: hypothetical protein AVDCRST_MAG77-411 [uncultured Chloroflexi bacterium]|uniref:VOC domain-containing protein n=1 Tax=uncultured Chloroflexota bacterium TaxID=166587 RepID=A0A6J4HBM7_9CHLR|nr:MAG: hypothetical protein AVDCRST_MAG77-411 [uncultured Chloroflexota bacterium]